MWKLRGRWGVVSLREGRGGWEERGDPGLSRQRAAVGQGSTLSEVFHASYQRLVVQMYGVVGDISQAEDLVQEAFVRAAAAGNRFRRAENHEPGCVRPR